MPKNIEAELALLGSIVLRPRTIDEISDILRPEDFHRAAHRVVYRAMLDLHRREVPIDGVLIAEELQQRGRLEQAGGMDFLISLGEAVPTSYNARHYAHLILDKAGLRGLARSAWEIYDDALKSTAPAPEQIEAAEKKIFDLGAKRVKSDLDPIREIVMGSFKDLDESIKSGAVGGAPTGFIDLDKLIGLEKGELVIVAARPSMGKSAFAMQIAMHAAMAEDCAPVALFTLEMSAAVCGLRLCAALGRVDLHAIRTGEFSDRDWSNLTRAASALSETPLFIDDAAAVSSDEIRAKCRRLKAREGLSLVVVDYIQLMKPAKGIESREQQIADISRSLKAIAKELDVPVIALSQLNRQAEMRQNKRPLLSDLRESGAIEQDADKVVMLYRDEYYNENTHKPGVAEALVRKNRNGPVGGVELAFLAHCAAFADLQKGKY